MHSTQRCCKNHRTRPLVAVLLLFFLVTFSAEAAEVPIIEADHDLQLVVGDLFTLSIAMRLYYEDTHKTQCPKLEDLAPYFKQPLPKDWTENYRTAEADGKWWAGRKVPEFSSARKFIRANADWLEIYDMESQSAWMGGSFAWMEAVSFEPGVRPPKLRETRTIHVVQGQGKSNQHLFFNADGTCYYWWSPLLYTTNTHATALKKFASQQEGIFVIPSAPSQQAERITASPVSPPPDFNLGREEEEGSPNIEMGDVIFNPIPRPRS